MMIPAKIRSIWFARAIFTLGILVSILAACTPPAGDPTPTEGVPPATTVPERVNLTTGTVSAPDIPAPAETRDPEPTPTRIAFPISEAASTEKFPSAAAQAGCHVTQFPQVSQDATLILGPSDGIPESTAEGEALVIIGRVYAEDCTPLPGASLHVWQTDPTGEYGPGHDTQEMECCYLQGEVRTDENGYYRLLTRMPGYYKGLTNPPPAHIHVEVDQPDAVGAMLEIVFAGDPYLRVPAMDGYVVASLEHHAPPDGRGVPYLYGVADLLLQRRIPAPDPSPEAGVGSSVRTFEILAEESEASYQIREKFVGLPLNTSAVATTHLVEGSIILDLSSPQPLMNMEVTVDLRGLDSGEINRDEKLVDRWLVTQEFPYAQFVGQIVENGPEVVTEGTPVSFTLLGDLTIRDVTRPVALQATARLDGDRISGTASTVIKMTDFGIDPPNLLGMVIVEDEVQITINLAAQETQT